MEDQQPISFPDHEHEGVEGQDGRSADADGGGGAHHGHSQSQSQFYEVPRLTNPSNRHRRTAFTGQQNDDDANRWRLRAEALEGELGVEKRKLELERQRSQAAWERVAEVEDQRKELEDQQRELKVKQRELIVQQREARTRDQPGRIQQQQAEWFWATILLMVAQLALCLLPTLPIALRVTITGWLFWWAVLQLCLLVLDACILRFKTTSWVYILQVQFIITAAFGIYVLYPILFPKPKPWYYFNF